MSEKTWIDVMHLENMLRQCEAKVAELEADRCDDCGTILYSGPPDCPMCGAPVCCEQCCRIEYLKAKVAELRKENDDLMTLAIPELQLDLKDAQAKITAVHVWYSKRGDWQELVRILKENRDE